MIKITGFILAISLIGFSYPLHAEETSSEESAVQSESLDHGDSGSSSKASIKSEEIAHSEDHHKREEPIKSYSFLEKCPDIPSCANFVAEALGQKYIFGDDIRGKIQASSNLEINKENAELLFTNMLHLEGYSRVPLNQPHSFQIMRERDAREASVPTVIASQKSAPELTHHWDMFTLKYKAAHPESIDYLARLVTNFLSMYGQVVPAELSGMLIVTDTAPNLKKIYDIVRENDQKPSAEMKKKWDELEKFRRVELAQKRTQLEEAQGKASK